MIENENELIDKVQKFLTKSSTKYSAEVNNQITDLDSFNGNFWTDTVKKTYKRANKRRLCLHFSDWSVLSNAIASPYSNSPWHTELLSRMEENEDIQNTINVIEQDNDAKFEKNKAFERGVIAGAGYIVVTTDTDEITGEPKIVLEFVNRQGSVALDPNVQKVDASDADEGAIVNYISIAKAKRLYGEDIVPFDYPRAIPKLNFNTIDQWPNKEDKIQLVSYYCKNNSGTVDYYQICGNKVVKTVSLPIRFIPIVRFAGYEQYNNGDTRYTGIVSKTWTLQLGLNMAYSTLMERANRSIKANVIASTKAVENLDPYYEKKEDEDGSMILFNEGATPPTPLIEQFQTADLQNVIQTSREAIADVIGVPLSGILGNEDKTATEILIQQTNKESNVAIFYDNAYKANRTISRIIIELLNNGKDVLFELENGPAVVTNNIKHRQELQTIASLMPAEMQPLVAVHMCDTIDSNFVENIKNDIIANLGTNIKLTQKPEDPIAIHQMNQMKEIVDQTMVQVDALTQENGDLKRQIVNLTLALNNQKEKTMLDYQKHVDNMALEEAKLNLEAEKQGVETQLDIMDKQTEAAKDAMDIEMKKIDLAEKIIGGV